MVSVVGDADLKLHVGFFFVCLVFWRGGCLFVYIS